MEDPIKKFAAAIDKSIEQVRAARMEDERKRLMGTIGQDLAKMLAPFLSEMAGSAKMNKEELRDSMMEALGVLNAREMKIDTAPIIGAIEAAFMGIQLPEPKVTVNVPEMKMPEVKMPDEMKIMGLDHFMHMFSDKSRPIPVQLRNDDGSIFRLDSVVQMGGGGGGGKADFLTIKGFSTSAFAELTNPDGRIKVELPTGGSSLTDSELRASAVPVSQVSGASWSVSASLETTSSLFNADNRLRVSLETGGSGLTDSELRATAVPVSQVSGANWSVSVTDIFGSTGTNVVNPDGRLKVELPTGASGLTDTELRATAVPVSQVSGAIWSIAASDIFATTATSSVVNTDNRVKVELPSFTQPVSATDLDIRDLVNATDSVSVYQVSGANWSTNVTNTVTVTGSLTSVVASGTVVSDAVDDGSAPVKTGGIARTANPTAVSGGDSVSFSADDVGRQLVRPVQARDLLQTARATISNGTETTLLAGASGVFHDLVYVMAANNSDAAVSVDIRAASAANIAMTLQVPANGTVGIACPVPLPQDVAADTWTIDMGDITGTTVTVTALFSKEV